MDDIIRDLIEDDAVQDARDDAARLAVEEECRALGIDLEDECPECDRCGGSGVDGYYDKDDNEISRDAWLLLPEDEQRACVEPCGKCHGKGYIDRFCD